MHVVFCSDPLRTREVDSAFVEEAAAARGANLDIVLVSYERLVESSRFTKGPPFEPPIPAVYRGWMLRPPQYRRMYDGLARHGVRLLTSPEQYELCHLLPSWYALLEDVTPKSIIVPPDATLDEMMTALTVFADGAVLLKDAVKSRKHEWDEACFIKAASDRAGVERVVERFRELQGEDLEQCLVFRKFEQLERIGEHPKSKAPLSNELRGFVYRGKLACVGRHWDASSIGPVTSIDEGATSLMTRVRGRIDSPFFSIDVARRTDGEWIVIEIGDGQVSSSTNAAALFRPIAD